MCVCVCVCVEGGRGDFAECIAVDAFVYCHEVLMYVYTAHVFHCARDCCHAQVAIVLQAFDSASETPCSLKAQDTTSHHLSPGGEGLRKRFARPSSLKG